MPRSEIEEEIADEIAGIVTGDGYYATTIGIDAAREAVEAIAPLLNRVRAEALREAAEELEERWTTYTVGVQTHPVGVATISPQGSARTGQEFAKVLRARADRIEQNSEGDET